MKYVLYVALINHSTIVEALEHLEKKEVIDLALSHYFILNAFIFQKSLGFYLCACKYKIPKRMPTYTSPFFLKAHNYIIITVTSVQQVTRVFYRMPCYVNPSPTLKRYHGLPLHRYDISFKLLCILIQLTTK